MNRAHESKAALERTVVPSGVLGANYDGVMSLWCQNTENLKIHFFEN